MLYVISYKCVGLRIENELTKEKRRSDKNAAQQQQQQTTLITIIVRSDIKS
jgi:hypothetical protein